VRQVGDENPTQILEGGATTAGAQGGAGHPGGGAPVTDAFNQSRTTAAAKEPLRAFQQTAPLAPSFPRGGRAKWWTIPFIFVVALACIGVLLMKRSQRPVQRVVIKRGGTSETGTIVPPLPPLPPEAPEEAREVLDRASAMMPLDETGAKVSGDSTVFTKTLELGEDVTLSIPNAGGDVTIEGWDKKGAEIKITKRGGSDAERRAVPIMLSRDSERVALISPTLGHGEDSEVGVSYEIKVPRSLRQLEISSEQSEVRVKGLEGGVMIDVKSGKLSFDGLTGPVRGKLIKGDIVVGPSVNSQRDAQEFTVVRGNVNVTLGSNPNADLKAETMDGNIEVASAFPQIEVVKRPAGRHAMGRLGDGGSPLLIKVVNGDIKLKD
jgi:hypothetical protein